MKETLVTPRINKLDNQTKSTSKYSTHKFYNLTHTPQMIKADLNQLNSTTIKKRPGFMQTLDSSDRNPQDRTRDLSKSQIKARQQFNMTTIDKEFNFSLPKIKQQKRKQPKKGPFLQNWLDQALSSDLKQANTNDSEAMKSGLKNIKGFELDRLYLQSQNIGSEVAERLYKSLYIYTHGIDQVFSQLISTVKMKQNEGILTTGSVQDRLLNSFWKAFSRLLQNCTSYQTAYQIVEKKHINNIKDLKEKLTIADQQHTDVKRELEGNIHRLQRQLQEHLYQYGKLQMDFKILQSTYQLTDETFNDEVSLRLKFQQKINAVYTSYNQLKVKYESLIDKLQITNHHTMEQKLIQDQLARQIEVWNIKYTALEAILQNQQAKTTILTEELAVKSQQLEDMKMNVVIKDEKDFQGEDIMANLLQKQKMLQTKVLESSNRFNSSEKIVKQQKNFIQSLNQKGQNLREINDRLYQKNSDLQAKNNTLQNEVNQKAQKIERNQALISKQSILLAQGQSKMGSDCTTLADYQTEIEVLRKDNASKESIINNNSRIIQDLKAVKDKYERINILLKTQKQELQSKYNQNLQAVVNLQEERQGLRMLLSAKQARLKDAQSNIQREKDLCASKVNALQQVVTKKEAAILSYQKLADQNKEIIEGKNYNLQKIENNITSLKNDSMKRNLEFNDLKARYAALQAQQKQSRLELIKLNDLLTIQVKQIDQISSDLSSKTYLIEAKKSQKDSQLDSLMKLLSDYKQRYIERVQHIHPMLYEDLLMKVARNDQKTESAIQKMQRSQKQNEQIKLALKDIQERLKLQQQVGKSVKQQLELERQRSDRLRSAASRDRTEKKRMISENKEQSLRKELGDKNSQLVNLKKQKFESEEILNETRQINNNLIKDNELKKQEIQRLNILVQSAAKVTKPLKIHRQIQTEKEEEEEEHPIKVESVLVFRQEAPKVVQSKQVQTESAVHQTFDEDSETKSPELQQMSPREKKTERRVQAKDIRKALKFTYMRR